MYFYAICRRITGRGIPPPNPKLVAISLNSAGSRVISLIRAPLLQIRLGAGPRTAGNFRIPWGYFYAIDHRIDGPKFDHSAPSKWRFR